MSTIGGWLLASQSLEDGEEVKWSQMANRRTSGFRAVGGKLYITNKRILFNPHFFDVLFGAKTWNTNISNITSIDKEQKDGEVFSGGLRDRLKIILKNGDQELFVVNGLDNTIDKLQTLVK